MAKVKFAVGLVLLLGLLLTLVTPAIAAPDEVKWSRVNIPTEGKVGNWVLANGSNVQHLTMAIDDTLYCYANPSGTNYTLFMSTDGGYSWSYTDYDRVVVALACSSIDADIIYVTDGSHVYKSDDAGDSFDTVAEASLAELLDNNQVITCLAVGYVGDEPYVFIGTANSSQGGGIYYICDVTFGGGWTDLDVGNYDVYSIAGSPDLAIDSLVVAVVTDGVHTYVTHNYGVTGGWTEIELEDADGDSFAISAASAPCFPGDFDVDDAYELFIGVVGGDGGIYRVDEDNAYRFDVDADIISLDLVGELGNIQLLAGENAQAEVWYSIDEGDSWDSATKAPSGSGPTYVVMADDFAHSGKAYAATSGTGSAFSYTADGGITWNQVGLIDTTISIIFDLALSPNYSQDNTLLMVTWGQEHSLWRSLNGGTRWERVFTGALANIDHLVELSPQYGNGSQVVFVAGTSNSNPVIWKSTDNGQSFKRRSAPLSIDIWAVVDDTTLFVACHDGSNGLVYRTTDSGLSYSTGAVVGSQPLNSIVLSPNYGEDETILVGNSDGWVYWSQDNGVSFEPLPPDAISAPLAGSITIAFDPQFSSNDTIYAASDTTDEGIYRFIIGTSTDWGSIDSPTGGMLKQLMVSADGTLYATNFKPDGGMERCLNPTYSLGPTFETVTRGLDDGATLTKLWLYGNQLWSIDTANIKLMTFTDSLTLPVILISPPSQASGIGTIINYKVSDVSLDWEVLSGATDYEWQLDYDTDFSVVPDGFEGDTKASSAWLPELEPATTYYWRVRVTQPVLSPWSAKWSFTTSIGTEAIAPKLSTPEAGASGVLINPIFQWSAVAGADSYELLVSTDASFTNPTILKIDDYALPTTAWHGNINLNYDTTYYWKVRATGSDTHSAWSAVSAFTTESLPSLEEPPVLPSPPPSTPSQPTTPDWVKYLVGALLASVVLLSVIVLVLVKGIRRL